MNSKNCKKVFNDRSTYNNYMPFTSVIHASKHIFPYKFNKAWSFNHKTKRLRGLGGRAVKCVDFWTLKPI